MKLHHSPLSENGGCSLDCLLSQGLLWQGRPTAAAPLWEQRSTPRGCIPFNVPDIDAALSCGGLACGAIHEVYMRDPEGLLAHSHTLSSLLAQNAISSHFASPATSWERANTESFPFCILWVGRRCWPTPFSLPAQYLRYCIFIDSPSERLALWAIETALKSPVVKLVIADMPRASLATSRRFALAAKSHNTTALLLRKHTNDLSPSAAMTRWVLAPIPSHTDLPAWELSLKKIKGAHPTITEWRITLGVEYGPREDLSLRILPGVVNTSYEEKVKAQQFGT